MNMSDFKYIKACITCVKRETCEWNNGKIMTCEEWVEDKEWKPNERD
jgi:hypothetical protein